MAASRTMTSGIFCPHPVSSICPEWTEEEHLTGTSIFAIEYDGGVVIGADARTTTGAYVFNRVTDKLTHITDHIYALRSGSSADTQAVCDIVSYHLGFHRIERGEEPMVKTAATVCRNLCYNYRDSLSAGMIVAGWDKYNGGQVYVIPIGGMLTRQPLAIGGSGSTYIYAYCDANIKENMTKDECLKFAANSLSLAMNRDGSSGGVIRLAVLDKNGVKKHILTGDNIPKFFEG